MSPHGHQSRSFRGVVNIFKQDQTIRAVKRPAAVMLLVTVLLVAASCSVANARSPKRSTFETSPRGDDYITQSSLYSSGGESQKIFRKYRPSLGSTQSSNNFSPPFEDQQYYGQFTQPSRAQRRSRKYVTSDKIRSKLNRGTQVQKLRKTSKEYSREYLPVNRKQKNSNEYLPGLSDQDNTNQYDQVYQSIGGWKQEHLNKPDGSAKFSRPENLSQFESQYTVQKENGFNQPADYSVNFDRVENEQSMKIKETTKSHQYDGYGAFESEYQGNDQLTDSYVNYNPLKDQSKKVKDTYKFNSYSTPKTNDQSENLYKNYKPYHDQLNSDKVSTPFSQPENQYSVLTSNEFDQSAGSRRKFNPIQEQSLLKTDNVPTKHSQLEDYSQFNGYSVQIPNDKSPDSYENNNPVKDTVYSQNTFLPSTEIKPASFQYLPPAEIKDYYLPSQVDILSKGYQSEVYKPFEQYLPSRVNIPAEEFQPIHAVVPSNQIKSAPFTVDKDLGVNNNTPSSFSDAFSHVTSEKPQQKVEYLPPSINQLPTEYVSSSNDQFVSNQTNNFDGKGTREHYNHVKGSEASIYIEPEVITTSNPSSPEDEKVNLSSFLPQIEQPVFERYTPDQNYNILPDFIANSTADRRNDISSGIQSNPTRSFTFPQKKPTTALRPIKQFNYGISPFQNTAYPIDRSSLDQNPLKIDTLKSNFVSQSSFFDPANTANQFTQFGSKMTQQSFNGNNVYASSRSSNIASPIQQLDLPYETSTHGLSSSNNNVASNSVNNLGQPIELILPSQSQNLQQQGNSYASNYAHHSYSHESTTEEIPILKQTNEIAYDGSFHYETLTGDQTHVIQEGHIENPGTDNEEQVIHGSYSFLGSDGITYTINYVADANGFRAIGDHLPTPPPIPEVIQRSIDMNLAAEANKAAQSFHFEPSSLGLADELNRAGQDNSYDLMRRNYNIDSINSFKNYRNSLSRNANNYKNSSKIHQNHNYQNSPSDNIRNQGFSHGTKSVYQPRHNGQSNGKSGIINIQNNPSSKLDTPSFPPSNYMHNNQNPQSNNNNNFQSYQTPKSISNNNYQSYQAPRSINNNNVQTYDNSQSITNNEVPSYQTPQSIRNDDVQSYQTPQSISNNDVPSYQTPQSVSFDNVQSFQTPQTVSNNNYQNYQTPQSTIFNNNRSYESPQSVNNLQNYQSSRFINNNNFQDYHPPQFLKSDNTQDHETSQDGNNNNFESYKIAQTDNDNDIQTNLDSNYESKIDFQETQSPQTSNQNPQIERKDDLKIYQNNQHSFNNYPESYQIPGTNENYDKNPPNPGTVNSNSQDIRNIPTNFNNNNQNNQKYPVAMDKRDSIYENSQIDDSNPYPEMFKIIRPTYRSYPSSENNVQRSIVETKEK